MCLYKINERLAGRGTKVYTGWKVFVQFNKFKYNFRYYLHEGKSAVPVNQWLKAGDTSIVTDNSGGRYDSGFHIYTNPHIAKYSAHFWDHLVAVKVKYRKVVARGREASQEVVVAKEMYVPCRKRDVQVT